MKVFIMRHGESEVMAQSDKERRLTDYGKHQSTLQGEWLQQYLKMTGIVLDKVLVSPYTRAQQTFTAVSAVIARTGNGWLILETRRWSWKVLSYLSI